MIRITKTAHRLAFTIRVVPRASRTEVVGEFDGALRIRIAAPPVDGAANRELIRFLAKELKVPQTGVEIVSGLNSKNKVVSINDIADDAIDRLRSLY